MAKCSGSSQRNRKSSRGASARRSQSMSRMQRAEALLSEGGKSNGNQGSSSGQVVASESFDSGLLECRSDRNVSEASSDLLHPRWRRLIKAVSQTLGQRFHDIMPQVPEGYSRILAHFIHTDSTGGGTQMDIHQCIKGSLEAMELSDKSTAFVLIGAYHYLQADDLKLTSHTWRSLIVTSLLVAANELCEHAEREQTMVKLRNSVAHWWSGQKADRAFEVFTRREAFQREQLNQQKIVALYFELRARSLEVSAGGFDDDSNSGLAICEFSQKVPSRKGSSGSFGKARAAAASSPSGAPRVVAPSDRSGASLALSESKSRSTYNDGYASDTSVLSI